MEFSIAKRADHSHSSENSIAEITAHQIPPIANAKYTDVVHLALAGNARLANGRNSPGIFVPGNLGKDE